MANPNWKGYTTTAIVLSDSNEVERNCKKLLKAFDKGKKHLLTVLCSLTYPEYFEPDKTITDCPLLEAKVKQFYKEYSRNIVEDAVLLGWDKKYSEQLKMFDLLNNKLAGGATAFVVDLLTTHFTLLQTDGYEIPSFSKEIHESASHKKEAVTAQEETPVSVPTPAPTPAPVQPKPVQNNSNISASLRKAMDSLPKDDDDYGGIGKLNFRK